MESTLKGGPRIEQVTVSSYRIPTQSPESDGTIEWNSTTLVLVEVAAGGKMGLGYSYASLASAEVVRTPLSEAIVGQSAFDLPGVHSAMGRCVRNLGRPGAASMAISAVDAALWDLKARLLGLSLLDLLGAARDRAPVYGSGGFTSYSLGQLQEQLGGWASQGLGSVKMKIGREPERDRERVRAARAAIGPEVRLLVDANGAYSRKQALQMAERLAEFEVSWFEEPVSSDDLEGLRLLRDRAPAGMEIAAGEYGFDSSYFRRMLAAGAVDVLQADATRCAGLTGFLEAGALCRAFALPFSFHCAPALHAAVACALPEFQIGEYFFDHARIEEMFFAGVPALIQGALVPDRSAPGLGLELKRREVARFAL